MSVQSQFEAWVKQTGGIVPAGLALEISPQHVSFLQRGKRRPSPALAERIGRIAGIDPGQWFFGNGGSGVDQTHGAGVGAESPEA